MFKARFLLFFINFFYFHVLGKKWSSPDNYKLLSFARISQYISQMPWKKAAQSPLAYVISSAKVVSLIPTIIDDRHFDSMSRILWTPTDHKLLTFALRQKPEKRPLENCDTLPTLASLHRTFNILCNQKVRWICL